MSLEKYFPELKDVPKKCADCGHAIKGPIRYVSAINTELNLKPLCRGCFRKRLGWKSEEDMEKKLAEMIKKAAIKTGEKLAARSLNK